MVYHICMKKVFKLLFLSSIVFTTMGCNSKPQEPKPVDVIVISGQSNAVGCTRVNCISKAMGYSKYQEYMGGYPEIQIAYDSWTKDIVNDKAVFYSQNASKDDDFVKVMLGQGNSLVTFGL